MDLKAFDRQVGITLDCGRSLGAAFLAGLLFTGCASKPFVLEPVSPGIFEGYKPRTRAHFETLRARGIRTILSVEALPWDVWPELRQAREFGIEYRDVPIMATPLEPNDSQVKAALSILHDSSLYPIYLHCFLGEDRTTFLIGLYRIYFQDWTPQAAWEEMLRSGFHVRWSLKGFSQYFWSHTHKPEWVLALASERAERPP